MDPTNHNAFYGGFIITPFINANVGGEQLNGFDITLPNVDLWDVAASRFSAKLINKDTVEIRIPFAPAYYLKDFDQAGARENKNNSYIKELHDADAMNRTRLQKTSENNVRIFRFMFPVPLTTKYVSKENGDPACKVLQQYVTFVNYIVALSVQSLPCTNDHISWRVLVLEEEKCSLVIKEEKSEIDQLADQYQCM
jgi:hypothetical protein